MPPQNGVTGGRAAADEGNEEALLTSLKSWASSPKSLLGQPAMAQDEGNEEALLTNLNFWASAPKTLLGQAAMAQDEGNEEALLTNLNFWASAPDYLPRKFKCEIFLDFNLIFQYLCPCLDVFFKL